MGLLTKFLRNAFYHCLSCVLCDPGLAPQAQQQPPTEATSRSLEDNPEDEEREQSFLQRGLTSSRSYTIHGMSVMFDLLDIMNAVLDIMFVVRLFQLPDSIAYACILTVGLVLGRLVVFRSTTLLFFRNPGGIQWNPFWIRRSGDVDNNTALDNKNQRAFSLLYCLLFSESAVFLFEDYPSLVTYAHWPAINFPPSPLETLDNYNIALSAAKVALLMVVFLLALFLSLSFQLSYREWGRSWRVWLWNGTKIAVFLACCALLAKYVIDILKGAIEFAFQDIRQVPSHELLWGLVELCGPETMPTRYELCDERIFLIRTAIAWLTASIFFWYLIFRPAAAKHGKEEQDESQSPDVEGGEMTMDRGDFSKAEGAATAGHKKSKKGARSSQSRGHAGSLHDEPVIVAAPAKGQNKKSKDRGLPANDVWQAEEASHDDDPFAAMAGRKSKDYNTNVSVWHAHEASYDEPFPGRAPPPPFQKKKKQRKKSSMNSTDSTERWNDDFDFFRAEEGAHSNSSSEHTPIKKKKKRAKSHSPARSKQKKEMTERAQTPPPSASLDGQKKRKGQKKKRKTTRSFGEFS